MPTIKRLNNCSINLYSDDHLPPHFHVRMQDGRDALIEIANLTVLSEHIAKRELTKALSWATENRTLLFAKWEELNP